jgi:A/G-specific adenine glycosylase
VSKAFLYQFAERLLIWHKANGRHDLPWQGNRDPYAVWVSEIMLQQTQVATVLERYPRFMQRFPSVKQLAAANIDEVLAEWAGLGYYSRARNLHACAKQVVEEFDGHFPKDPLLLEKLKGIGRSTAGAITAFAFEERAPILDANVKRILARLFAIEQPLQEKAVTDELWILAERLLPKFSRSMPTYTQALMDFGATWCTARKPVCISGQHKCPFEKNCQANLSNQVLLLPKKISKTKSPELICNMIVLRHSNSILLQKRPPKAIWGGLWSLPESDWISRAPAPLQKSQNSSKVRASDLLRAVFKDEDARMLVKKCSSLEHRQEIKHVFTHRRLWMQIWEANLQDQYHFVDSAFQWVDLDKLGRYGLPQPIKLLLQGLSLARDVGTKS